MFTKSDSPPPFYEHQYRVGDIIFTWGDSTQGIGIIELIIEGVPRKVKWIVKPKGEESWFHSWNIRHATAKEVVMLRLTGKI